MSLTVNLFYTGTDGAARRFAEEMVSSGTVAAIRAEDGNERYEYFQPLEDPETILLIDQWRDQEAIDAHHASPMMQKLAQLRDKYDLHMQVRRYADESVITDSSAYQEPLRISEPTGKRLLGTPVGLPGS